ncbi:hypothetical protein [Endozoicomonas sp. ALC066]|uniref:hypothetical protein n=1 Tax=Endozoicomonas sp. ALC066 TaxID=3403078 RepID=UPI003BB54E1A
MMGFISRKEAISLGCTHQGRYYGVPLWLGNIHGEPVTMMAKWSPLEVVIELNSYIEMLLSDLFFPDRPKVFQVLVTGKIVK